MDKQLIAASLLCPQHNLNLSNTESVSAVDACAVIPLDPVVQAGQPRRSPALSEPT